MKLLTRKDTRYYNVTDSPRLRWILSVALACSGREPEFERVLITKRKGVRGSVILATNRVVLFCGRMGVSLESGIYYPCISHQFVAKEAAQSVLFQTNFKQHPLIGNWERHLAQRKDRSEVKCKAATLPDVCYNLARSGVMVNPMVLQENVFRFYERPLSTNNTDPFSGKVFAGGSMDSVHFVDKEGGHEWIVMPLRQDEGGTDEPSNKTTRCSKTKITI